MEKSIGNVTGFESLGTFWSGISEDSEIRQRKGETNDFTELENHQIMTSFPKQHWRDPRDSYFYTQVTILRIHHEW